ncbi:MAG: acyl-CoA thioesterase [Jiangellaceae bacterium]
MPSAAVTTLVGKPTVGSRLTISQVMGPPDVNLMGTVHGGVILRLVDTAAGVVAARHCAGSAVTAFMDEMAFLVAVHIGDVVHVQTQVNWAGTTSMEVGVRVLADRWNASVPATHVATAYLVMVAVGEDGRPRPVPPVIAETDEDRRRFREAQIRRDHRLDRRRAINASRRPNP